MKKISIFIMILIGLMINLGCGKKTMPEKYAGFLADRSGKYVRLGFYGSPEEIDPIKAPEFGHDQLFANLIFAAPLRKLDDGTYTAYLFEDFETGLDGQQLVVKGKWRKGLKWHDGVEFKPYDFDYCLKQMSLKDRNSPFYEAAKSVVFLENNENKVEIRFADNSIKCMDMLCASLIPSHLLGEEAVASGTTLEGKYKKFLEKPVGLGPYKIVDNDQRKFYLLEPDTNFFDGKASARPKIVIACIYDLQQYISDFREGMFDWVNIPSMLGEQLKSLGIENVIYMQYPNPAVMTWVFNTKNEKLKDVKLRKALNLIMDRDCAKQSMGADATEFFDNLVPRIEEEKKSSEAAFGEGIKLLTEAGITDKNNDGFREINGETFSLKILVNDDNMLRRMVAERMILKLKKAGIKAEIEAVAWSDFIVGKLRKGEFETALLSYHISENSSLKNLFATKKDDDIESLNFTGISDEELDKDLTLLDSAVTTENKAEAYKRVNEKLSLLCPCAFFVRPNNMALVHGEKVSLLKAKVPFWKDIYNWKLFFGKESSRF